MGRVKIPMKRIEDKRKRIVTFKGRKDSLVKKARELGTLCDVNVSMIMFSEFQENAEIFPQDPLYLKDMIKDYQINRANYPSKTRSFGLSDFYRIGKSKIEKELEKTKKENLEIKYPTLSDSDKSSLSELNDLSSALGTKINEVIKKIDLLKLTKTSKTPDLDAQVSLRMPQPNPNPITMITPSENNNNNSLRSDDHVESDRSSNTNSDNVYSPVMLMGQDLRSFHPDKRCIKSLDSKSTATTTSQDDNGSFDGADSGLQPEVPQCMDLLSCFRD